MSINGGGGVNTKWGCFENRSYFGEKASGTSAVTAVIYAGTAQSLILEPWPRQTVLQVPKMKENAERRAFTL